MEHRTQLGDDERRDVGVLDAAATRADGLSPLNEQARLAVRGDDARHWLVHEAGRLVGYAQWSDDDASGQLVVHPEHRRRGVGTTLLDALRAARPDAAVWAFGDLPAARALADARALTPTRGLHVMERDLSPVQAPTPPEGVTLRPFTDADADAFLAVNAAAFASHPEQGHFDADDLAQRQAEAWWDPSGLILAVDDEGVVGFHWTKRHDADTGEVYVLGVHPRGAGRGLGGVLLDAGLAHLTAGGASHVLLFVDADNAPAVRLYERNGFAVTRTDRLYSAVPERPSA